MIEEKKFKRKTEDFVCENCGEMVKGNGYTDHCPKCLFSKHVDINPGDRNAYCRGIMEPIGVEKNGELYILLYQCQKCGYKHKVKKAEEDNFEEIIKISKKNYL
jgi:rubrerythrin